MANITCSNCGTAIDYPNDLETEPRKPCVLCGSTVRTVEAVAHAGGTSFVGAIQMVTIGNDIQDVNAQNALLLQAVVIGTERVSEGRLIEAVALPWFDIIKLLKSSPHMAFQISPEKWEEIIAGAYRKAGFDQVILTPRSADAGRDVIATKFGIGSVRIIDQVKAYKPRHLVTANDVRALLGVLGRDGAAKGFLTTTSDFAPRLRSDPLLQPIIPSRIELINGTALLARLSGLAGIDNT